MVGCSASMNYACLSIGPGGPPPAPATITAPVPLVPGTYTITNGAGSTGGGSSGSSSSLSSSTSSLPSSPCPMMPPQTTINPHHQHQSTNRLHYHQQPLNLTFTSLPPPTIQAPPPSLAAFAAPTLAPATIQTSTIYHHPTATVPYQSPSLIIHPASWKQSYGMEQVWQCEFHRHFISYYPHVWTIMPVERKPMGTPTLQTFVDSAKVRFCCDVCGHGWTSMKGRVAFWFDFFPSYYGATGFVTFKLYGQQCDRCKSDRYEQPMWYPEEVAKVMANLYNRVGQVYYGFYCPPIEKARRAGKPRTPHNGQLCQACKDGVCADRK